MIELAYSPKLHIQALYRSIALVYYDFESMFEHYRPAANMADFDIRKWRRVRFNECIRQINLIRESKGLNPVKENATLSECIEGLWGRKMSKTKYPRIVDAGSDNIFAKAFITANGNEELCNATGREL